MNMIISMRLLYIFAIITIIICGSTTATAISLRGVDTLSGGDGGGVLPCKHVPDSSVFGGRGYASYFQYAATEENSQKFTEFCDVSNIVINPGDPLTCPDLDTSHFRSQSDQDRIVNKLLFEKKNGYFVDLAANHWCDLSNSYFFEKHQGWQGLCVEAAGEYIPGLATKRNCTVINNVIAATDNEVLKFVNRGVYGGIVAREMDNSPENMRGKKAKPVARIAVTLGTILRTFNAPQQIDYLSLDVEGAEFVALLGMDFSHYVVSVMTVERPTEKVHRILSDNGYWWVKFISTFGEALYIHKSFDRLEEVMFRVTAEARTALDTAWTMPTGRKVNAYLLQPAWASGGGTSGKMEMKMKHNSKKLQSVKN